MNKSKRISTILLATACCVTYNMNVLAMEKDEISKEEFEKIRYEIAKKWEEEDKDEEVHLDAETYRNMVIDQHVYEEIERRKKEERERKEKDKQIAKRPWTKLFDTNLISEKKFELLLMNATEDIKNKMQNPKHGFFLTQTKEGAYDKLLRNSDGTVNINKDNREENKKQSLELMDKIMEESRSKREDENKLLYQTGSYTLNNCKTRAATILNYLRNENALRGSLFRKGHVAGFTCATNGEIYLGDVPASELEGEWTMQKDKYRGNWYWEHSLKPLIVFDDAQNTGGLRNARGGNPLGSTGTRCPRVYTK